MSTEDDRRTLEEAVKRKRDETRRTPRASKKKPS
jgi:hypothetical protein